jgi:membrane protease YdiL (CAAX protease family)
MKKFAVEIKWGIRYAFIWLFWLFIEKNSGYYEAKISDHALYSLLFIFITLFVYFVAVKEKKNEFFKGEMSWKQGCITGIFLTVVMTVLTPFCQIIFHKAIAPEFSPNMIEFSVSKGNSRETAENYFNLPSYILQSVFGTLSLGVVLSAIVALFLQTKTKK